MKLIKTYYIFAVTIAIMALNLASCEKFDDSFALDKAVNEALLPEVDFTASTTDIVQFETIDFSPTVVNPGDLYTWTFKGGSPGTSLMANVNVKYTVKGTYPVSLKIRNASGAKEVVKEGFIKVEGEPLDPAVRVRMNFEQNLFEEYASITASGSVAGYEEGKVNDYAATFNGSSALTIPGYTGVNGTADRTIAVWIKSAASKNSCVTHWGASALGSRATFRMTPAKIRFEYSGGGVTGKTIINDDEWHHVAYTVSGGSVITLYVDGKVDAVHNANPRFTGTGGTGNAGETEVEIGSQLGANFYSGAMDNVLIYNRALTEAEIAKLAGL